MSVREVSLWHVRLPLIKPYKVSFRTYTELEPILVRVTDKNGSVGWGEAYIPAGSTRETAETGWQFCCEQAPRMIGRSTAAAKVSIDALVGSAPFAATALLTALDMMARHDVLETLTEHRTPLLVPVSGKIEPEIAREVEQLLEQGYRTLKVKVGWDVDEDLSRVRLVQKAAAGRARITIDANRGYNAEQGRRFASSLNPESIDLFEQPCEADEWEANAAVARVSTVPIMLDESIRNVSDIERASTVPGVKLVKLKLKRIGGIDRARQAMQRARAVGLDVCLGDGVATELLCWVEACTGRGLLTRAGDMNGFLKPKTRLFTTPLAFEQGSIVLRPGYWPQVDLAVLKAHSVRAERFAPTVSAA